MSTARATAKYVMLCPKCGHETVELPVPEGLGPQSCSQCHGVWFERGQLARLMGTAHDVPEFKVLIIEAKVTSYDCPSCKKSPLLEMPYGRGSETLLDWCNSCGGLWLNVGAGLKDIPGILAKLKGILLRPSAREKRGTRSSDGPIPYDDFRINLLALPLAVSLVSLSRLLPEVENALKSVTAVVHELGHLLACVVTSYPGYPLPQGFDIGGDGARSWVLYGIGWLLIAAAGLVGWTGRLVLPTAFAILLLLGQNLATFLLPSETHRFVFAASGMAAELALSTLLLCAFFYRMPPLMNWSWWRPVVLFFGAFGLVSTFEQWSRAARDTGLLSWDKVQGFDSVADLAFLRDTFHWSPASMLEFYLTLGMACYIFAAAHYLFFLIASEKNKIYLKPPS